LVDGHARLAALDIPQRLVHAADGVVEYRPIAPVGAVVAGLPGVFDAVGGLADEERLQVLLHRRDHQVGALRERGATIAIESGLVRGDLDHDEAHARGLCSDDRDVLDLRGRHAAGGAFRALLSRGAPGGERRS
jgi:hypothetical protein